MKITSNKSTQSKSAQGRQYRVKKSTWITSVSIGLALLLLTVLIIWLKPSSQDTSTASIRTAADPISSQAADWDAQLGGQGGLTAEHSKGQGGFVTGLELLPRSLSDTQVDGEILIDDAQQLVVSYGLRRLFDYFFSAIGEEDAASIQARIEAYIRHHTPEPAASQAIAILHNYIRYQQALTQLQSRYGNLQMQATRAGEMDLALVSQRQHDIKRLREQYFNPATIKAFFASEDAYDDYAIAMMRIEQDSQLSQAQKQAQRADYIGRMPDSDNKQYLTNQANLDTLMQRSEQMQAQGASAGELFAMRSQLVGAAAAARLAQMDKQNADFDNRFAHYHRQKQVLMQQYGVAAADNHADSSSAGGNKVSNTDNKKYASNPAYQQQLQQLQQSLFSEAEQKRLDGYAQLLSAQPLSESAPNRSENE